MSVNACLTGVVGLSADDCACFEADRPADFNESLSGYYLDSEEYGIPLQIPASIQACSTTDVWSVLDRARSAGITQFVTELGASLLSGPYNKKVSPFNDWIGRNSHSMNLSGFSTWTGIKICPKIFRGVIGKTHQLELYVSGRSGDTIAVNFYDEAALTSGTPIGTVNVVMSGTKGVATISSEIIHDFMTDYSQRSPLWILYQPGAGYPRNNTSKCATCGSKDKWEKYFSISGVTASSLADIRDLPLKTDSDCELNTTSAYSYGLRLNMGVSCGNSWLCQNFDYDNDDWARVMAEAICLFGIKALVGIILKEPGPNKYTQITREELAYHRDRVGKLLEIRMPWLADNMPVTASDCFECNEKVTARELLI